MKVELNIQPDRKIVLSSFQKQLDGSGCASLSLISSKFQYSNDEFYFDSLLKFTEELKEIYKSLLGSTELRFHYESEYLKFEAKSMGHIELTGEFLEYGEIQQVLNFGFVFDQSYLPEFIEQLEAVNREMYS